MSWLFSRALAEEYSEATYSAGELSVRLNSTPTPQAFLPPDRMTAFSRPSRFGMTFAPLTDDRGEALLMSYLADFHAKTSAPQGKEPESTESDPAYGGKWRELSVRYDPATSSWKTHRSLWDEDLSACSLTLPKWGSMRGGVLLERTTPGLPTREKDSGWWPTPNVPNGGHSVKHVTDWRGKSAYHNGKKVQVGLESVLGGAPHPTFLEWLMGWPLGWTDTKHLETDKFRQWQRQHSVF